MATLPTVAAATFPKERLRRLRRTENLRRMVRETKLSIDDFVYPMFVTHGKGIKEPIASMPDNYRWSLDTLAGEVKEIASLGIPGVLLFGIPEWKDEVGSGAYAPHGIIQDACRVIKDATPDLIIVTDVCLCEYTSHGHCGVIVDGYVDNDQTLELLAQTALTQAQAGADIIAPSDMMDGRVAAIRQILDESGLANTPIMAYAAKYASAFYGPFREAAGSAPQFGDRRSYQMDPPNVREALREIELDIAEGADIIMVKPALAYLDVIAKVRETFNHPVAAYNVSGEFSMIRAAAQNGWIDGEWAMMEVLTAIKRAGADIILSYFAKDVARKLAG